MRLRSSGAFALVLVAIMTACSGLPPASRKPVAARPVAPIVEPATAGASASGARIQNLRTVTDLNPVFGASVLTIDEGIKARMGTSWRAGCPVPLHELRVIEVTFWSFEGVVRTGELMVHRRYVEDIVAVFRKLFDARFRIERMELANGYMGNDPPLALRNNTAGFNCRRSVGSGAWSEHAYGRAVDINPDQNPYVSPSGRVEPPFGAHWVDRSLNDPGMIRPGDVVVKAFRAIGWRWGGAYRRNKDWMHFSLTGR